MVFFKETYIYIYMYAYIRTHINKKYTFMKQREKVRWRPREQLKKIERESAYVNEGFIMKNPNDSSICVNIYMCKLMYRHMHINICFDIYM